MPKTITQYRESLAAENNGIDPYADLTDQQFAARLHERHYGDIPFADFAGRVGLQGNYQDLGPQRRARSLPSNNAPRTIDGAPSNPTQLAMDQALNVARPSIGELPLPVDPRLAGAFRDPAADAEFERSMSRLPGNIATEAGAGLRRAGAGIRRYMSDTNARMASAASQSYQRRRNADLTAEFNTELTPWEESLYQTWRDQQSKRLGRDLALDEADYDLRGAWRDGASEAANGHLPDTYKKPNHPTFSRDSKYSGDASGVEGGEWKQVNGRWQFTASPDQFKYQSPEQLQRYFQDRERDSDLIVPSNVQKEENQRATAVKGAEERAFQAELAAGRMGRRERQAAAEAAAAVPEDAGPIERAVQSGVTSTLVTAPIVTAGALIPGGQVPALVALGGMSGAQRYGELRAAGVSEGEAALSAGYLGGLEALTEKIPMGAIAKNSPFLNRAAEFLVTDVLGENVSSVAELVDDYRLGLRDDVTMADVRKAIEETTAATIVGAGATVSLAEITKNVLEQANQFAAARAPKIEPPVINESVQEIDEGPPAEEITLEGDGQDLPGQIDVDESEPESVTMETDPVAEWHAEQAALDHTDADQVTYEDPGGLPSIEPEPEPTEPPGPRTMAQRREEREAKHDHVAQAIDADTKPMGVTYVQGEHGNHGVAVNGRVYAWYRNESVAREEVRAHRADIAAGRIDPVENAAAIARETPRQRTDRLAHDAATSPKNDLVEPSQKAIDAGIYRKGHLDPKDWHGLNISIENPKGSIRRSKPGAEVTWERKMRDHYGYIRGTTDNTDEHVDVFVGPSPGAESVYVIDQVIDGKFDEPKVMMGYRSQTHAEKSYLRNYQDGWNGIGAITPMSIKDFKEWLESDGPKKPLTWKPPRDERIDQNRDRLKYMAERAGWQEIGGQAISQGDAVRADVIGRTKWLPREPWFAEVQRTAPLPGNKQGKATALAVEKALAGKKLTAAEDRHIRAMNDAIEHEAAEETRLAESLEKSPEELSDAELAAVEARLERLSKMLEQRDRSAADYEPDIPSGPGIMSDEPMFERAKDSRTGDMFGLTPPAGSVTQKPKAKPAVQADLFGGVMDTRTALEKVKAEKDRRRNEGQQSAETGRPDDLFSQARKQADVEDTKKKPAAQESLLQREETGGDQVTPQAYASGMSRRGDLEAAIESVAGVGTVITELSRNGMQRVADAIRAGKPVFVDSGAFSAFMQAMRAGRSKESLTDFDETLSRYDELAALAGEGTSRLERGLLTFVAPDVVGDQTATLKLLEQHKQRVMDWMEAGIEVIVPFQKGPLKQSEMYRRVAEILSGNDFVVGIPSNAQALSSEDLHELLRQPYKPERLHILGAVNSKRMEERMQVIREEYVDDVPGVTADANLVRAKLGRMQGLSGAERAETIKRIIKEATSEGAGSAPSSQATPAAKPSPELPAENADRVVTLKDHEALMKRLRDGEATVYEYKAGWKALVNSHATWRAELEQMTKAELVRISRGRPSDAKAALVNMAEQQILMDYSLSESAAIQFDHGSWFTSYVAAVSAIVERATKATLDKFSEQYKARVAAHTARIKGALDPKTLDDFRLFISVQGEEALSDEQIDRFDDLQAADSKERLQRAKAERERQRSQVQSAGRTVGATVIPSKHTKHGYPIFVVQMAERVERDVYDKLNTAAKQLGGYYSSYRGNGAIPGFTFKEEDKAQAFAALLQTGDTAAATEVAQARREDYNDDKSQSTIERLRSMADRLEADAQERLDADRKTNTSRRAGMAARAEGLARADISLARTMRNIADAIEAGKADFLEGVRTKAQVDMLRTMLRQAKYQEVVEDSKAKHGEYRYQDTIDREGEAPTRRTARYVEYPRYSVMRSDLAQIGRELMEIDGAKRLGESILKFADDLTADYTAFVKANLQKMALRLNTGEPAVFTSKAEAERVRQRSAGGQKLAVVTVAPRKVYVVLSPREAVSRGLWQNDDKLINVNESVALDVIDKIQAHNARAGRHRQIRLPWTFETAKERRTRLRAMGIENPSMLRAALREFVGLTDSGPKADPIKAKLRELVGRKGIGIDFFPTPAGAAADLVAKADIQPGMTVLEPSAGYGAIADEVRALGVEPDVVEMSSTLREILELKGYNLVGQDFTAFSGQQYDRIVMNPPFSNGMDIDHVRHAYSLLKPGGRIVAIMGEGAFIRSDRKATEFREWADELGGIDEQLPSGTFLDPSLPSTTGVNARVIVIDKPEAPMARRREQKGLQMPAAPVALHEREVRDEVNRILREFKTRPRLMVVQTYQQLPAQLRAAMERRGFIAPPRALQWQGGIYLIADQFTDIAEVIESVLHETVVHFGLRSVIDQETHIAILDGLARDQPMAVRRAGANEFGSSFDWNNVRMRRIAAEELLAYYAPMYLKGKPVPSKARQWVKKLIEALRAFVDRVLKIKRADTLQLPADYNKEQMERIIDALHQYLRQGRAPDYVEQQDAPMAEHRTVEVDRVRYPITNANGQLVAETPQQQMAFWRWFRGSKAVDARGRPLVFWHGVKDPDMRIEHGRVVFTPKFNVFDTTGRTEPGTYFSASEDVARHYGTPVPFYIKTETPLRHESPLSARPVDHDAIYRVRGKGDGIENAWEVAVFSPSQIKIAVGNRGTFDPNSDDIMFERAQRPVFYSALTRAVEESKTVRAPAAQWLATLRNSPGVKAEEIEWSGVEEWLNSLGRPATREQLADYLRANEIHVEEKVSGAPVPGGPSDELQQKHGDLVVRLTALGYVPDAYDGTPLTAVETHDGRERYHPVQDGAARWKDHHSGKWLPQEAADLADQLVAVRQAMINSSWEGDADHTQYGSYTLPGGDNYRELLMTLPVNTKTYQVFNVYSGEVVASFDTSEEARADAEARGTDFDSDTKHSHRNPDVYRSSHWSAENILAHVRFNERTDADGKHVLFVEEIQSDWHQAGRKKGYKETVAERRERERKLRAAKEREAKALAAHTASMQRWKEREPPETSDPDFWEKMAPYREWSQQVSRQSDEAFTELMAARAAVRDANRLSMDIGKVPDAPFKTTWPELAFKRVIRWAAEHGFDRIAWTTGEQQNSRYSLEKFISQLEWQQIDESTGQVRGWNLNGLNVLERITDHETLREIVGNEVAEKLLAAPVSYTTPHGRQVRVLEGLDLRVGGEGMRGFYDDILPKAVNKMVKKWGTRVNTTRIATTAKLFRDVDDSIRGGEVVHSVDVTPDMRDVALEGLPLFQRSGAAPPIMLRQTPKKSPEASAYGRLANRVIDAFNRKIGHKYGALGNLPEARNYLIERYRTLGGLTQVREVSRETFRALSAATPADAERVYAYLTTAGATADAIEDEQVRVAAEHAKQLIDEQGQALVQAGLLSEESYEAYRDQYLPRLYLRHILDDKGKGRAMGSGKKLSDMGYLKERKDIPEEVRKVILGEITDPAFLASFGLSRTMRDLTIMNFLQSIAQNRAWVPASMLIDWDGRKVSPYWLQGEAKQLRRQADHIKNVMIAGKARAIADRMDTAANAALETLEGADLSDFKQIPDSARYGSLRGLWVRKEIHEDLVGAYQFIEADSMLENIFGQGGFLTKATQAWKTSKVAMNVPSHFRNMMGNAMMLHLSGMPMARVPDQLARAIHSVATKDEWYQIAKKYGLKEATFANTELYRIRDEWLLLQKSTQPTANVLHAMFAKLTDAVGDVYQFEEALFKIAKLRDAIEREGMNEADGMIESHKWIFDYSLVPRWVRYLRNAPFGIPFLSYAYFALPRLAEVAVRRPWKFLPYVAVVTAIQQAIMSMYGADDDDLDKLRAAYPDWMRSRGGMLLMPWKDDGGRWQVVDLGYTVPWGQLVDVVAQVREGNYRQSAETMGLFSGPLPDIIAAWQTNTDPFTGRQIANSGDPKWKQALSILNYAWGMAAPGFITSQGALGKVKDAMTGRVDPRTGDPTLTMSQAWLRLFGVSVYPVDPEVTRARNIRAMSFEIDEVRRRLAEQMRDRNLTTEQRNEIQRVYQAEIRLRQEKLRKYQEESEIPESLRRTPQDLTGRVAPLIDGKSKAEVVRSLRDAGYPQLAQLFSELPSKPKPAVLEALQQATA